MVYTYTPTYYSSLQDTIASLCKSILPFSFKPGGRLTADQASARRHADALKWQQESFHRILHLSALHREGIVPASDVASFRSSMLATLLAPPTHPDSPAVLRDKLLFLQELLYAKGISAEEYNSSKKPLLQRLTALGVEIESRDVDVGGAPTSASSDEEEWSEIDLRDPPPAAGASDKPKHKAPIFAKSFISPWKSKGKREQDVSNPPRPPLAQVDQNHTTKSSVLMTESSPSSAMPTEKAEKGKRRHMTALFHNGSENKEPVGEESTEEKEVVKGRKKSSWGFDGLKKWKKDGGDGANEKEAIPVPCLAAGGDRSECPPPRSSYSECRLEASPTVAAGLDAKRAKKKLHTAIGDDSASDLFNDKVLVENTKKELSRIQAELSSANRNLNFSDHQIETISTRLPMDKSDLKTFFPKEWCDQHGDGVINAIKKEFKEHVKEMEKRREIAGTENWVAFEENHDWNFDQRAFSQRQTAVTGKAHESLSTDHFTNPFYDEKNPFWNPSYN